MKKTLKWMGIAFLLLTVIMVLFAMVGLKETVNLTIGEVSLTEIADGDYTGEYVNGRFSNTVLVSVRDHTITAIQPIKISDGQASLSETLTQRVLEAQQPDVDIIAGATASSKSFLKAVEIALTDTKAQ